MSAYPNSLLPSIDVICEPVLTILVFCALVIAHLDHLSNALYPLFQHAALTSLCTIKHMQFCALLVCMQWKHCCVMQQQVDGLSKRKAELQAEDHRPVLGPEDQRAALLAQIKADNEACDVAGQKVKQATEAIRQLERQGTSAQPARYSPGPYIP